MQSLLTPLGIGSMLLLLLSSVTLGYLIMNPASLGIFSEGESRGDRNLDSGEVVTHPGSTDLPSNVLPGSPDLATEEFRELNLDTLGTLPTGEVSAPLPVTGTVNSGATPTPTATAASSLPAPLPNPQSTSNLPTTAVPATVSMRPNGRSAPTQAAGAAPRPAAASQPAARPSAPARPSPAARSSAPAQANTATPARLPAVQAQPASPPVAAAPAPAATPAPSQSQDGYFYVTTPYNGDRSLEQARQAVGDAYVRNFPEGGAQVQVGAFRDRAGAEDLANELEQQGISAEVHQP
ncbi:MAG: SPOR domain-containing protein [Leptolyngbyaceae cyanobacterium RM1_406_9]|nr:SPOR domain-containing protein [Leptolyngbyaceae cyanobacterium RM1_406_9]